MRIPRWFAVPFVGVAVAVTTAPVLADARDIDGDAPLLCKTTFQDVPIPPAPGTGVNDGAFAHVCTVGLFGGTWQASTGEWIVFRIGWGTATEQQCLDFAPNVTVTLLFQGSPVQFDTVPCFQRPFPPFGWATQFRFLSHPLAAGEYTASFRFEFNAAVSDGSFTYPAGLVIQPQFPARLTVAPGG